eukprot:2570379-Karenia_brevis.AAC.1
MNYPTACGPVPPPCLGWGFTEQDQQKQGTKKGSPELGTVEYRMRTSETQSMQRLTDKSMNR